MYERMDIFTPIAHKIYLRNLTITVPSTSSTAYNWKLITCDRTFPQHKSLPVLFKLHRLPQPLGTRSIDNSTLLHPIKNVRIDARSQWNLYGAFFLWKWNKLFYDKALWYVPVNVTPVWFKLETVAYWPLFEGKKTKTLTPNEILYLPH